jgi:hypothetical protein
VRTLAARVDVLVEKFRVGALAQQALGYDDLKDDCRTWCTARFRASVRTGRRAKAGFPSPILAAKFGARSAFWPRFCVRAGHGGAYFDVSLADTIAGWSVWEVADHLGTGEDPGPLGTAHRLAAPYQKHSYVVAVSFWPSTVRIVHGYRYETHHRAGALLVKCCPALAERGRTPHPPCPRRRLYSVGGCNTPAAARSHRGRRSSG